MEKQTNGASLIEAIANTVGSLAIGTASQVAIFPLFGINVDLRTNFNISLMLSAIAIARAFIFRRVFEHLRIMRILP